MSIFSVTHEINVSASEMNNDLINDWAFQWKMSFNPDSSKKVQNIIFSSQLEKTAHTLLVFSKSNVSQDNSQKHLRVTLDFKLTFNEQNNGSFTQGPNFFANNSVDHHLEGLCQTSSGLWRYPVRTGIS